MAQIATLSSVGTAAIILNPVARTTTVMLSAATFGSTGAVTIEMTLDDPTTTPAPTLTWGTLSSGTAMLSSNVSSALIYTMLSPIGGVRVNSSANNTTWTLKALQSVTA